jgi:hypothetical protein
LFDWGYQLEGMPALLAAKPSAAKPSAAG